jgi:hypothetical protein
LAMVAEHLKDTQKGEGTVLVTHRAEDNWTQRHT